VLKRGSQEKVTPSMARLFDPTAAAEDY